MIWESAPATLFSVAGFWYRLLTLTFFCQNSRFLQIPRETSKATWRTLVSLPLFLQFLAYPRSRPEWVQVNILSAFPHRELYRLQCSQNTLPQGQNLCCVTWYSSPAQTCIYSARVILLSWLAFACRLIVIISLKVKEKLPYIVPWANNVWLKITACQTVACFFFTQQIGTCMLLYRLKNARIY